MEEKKSQLRVLELYSGIGGMHFALQKLNIDFKVVLAVDINPLANQIYNENFGKIAKHYDISTLTKEQLDALRCDLWTLSPSCQPYTRLGKQQGHADPRAAAFLHVLEILPTCSYKPKFIFIENVFGFETSWTAEKCREVLKASGYVFHEVLLSPFQIGIPNSRLRWYGLARLKRDEIENSWNPKLSFPDKAETIRPINNYLDKEVNMEKHSVPVDILQKYGHQLDIVKPSDTHSCCFTRGYTHLVQGSGSVLQMSDHEDIKKAFLENRYDLCLRYFTVREIARIMGFPEEFTWQASGASDKAMYRLLGNSINIHVVSALQKELLMN
ncbi:DNA methyltransferase [Schizosaccharomyces japonicus yFS275]|uniref:tRNA (cytosine(38)-C(5))-methyltransferase n=1 Tax=Schizosaccharomyces japonicus (strain yFS275 / FY16936) TaxID=402676 RepID=B6K0C0_SCHJY|nr:DNA methyltransferase [Schizosaccharomyces japonicus yFS275]EEB06270.1 DNA methyltransferase [Schizosaccharomyces japonicus yFS275]